MAQSDAIRPKLELKRDELQRELATIMHAESDETAQGETDTAHEWENAEVREALAREVADNLDAVQAALARLDDGSYGICTKCGSPIDGGRLEVLSESALCIACAGGSG